jgi:acetyl esterase/lipase
MAASLLALLLAASLTGGSSSSANSVSQGGAPYTYTTIGLNVSSFDGVVLPAFMVVPDSPNGTVFPAVVFSNSWSCDFDTEYYNVQTDWAAKGYVVMSYETRGWDGAGGSIGLGGPEDLRDHRVIVDLMVANAAKWRVNTSALATAGVSYGGGMAVLSAANDTRIKAALTLSGWGNLTTALFGGDTASLYWGNLLIGGGELDGHMPAELVERWDDLMDHTNVSSTSVWADLRSPLHYTKQLCGGGRKLPIFISNNLEDRLFKPDAAIYYRDHLAAAGCPAVVLLNQGVHASAEALYLTAPKIIAGINDTLVWDEALAWLERWLKGAPLPDGQLTGSPVRIQQRTVGLPGLGHSPYVAPAWPPAAGVRFALVGNGPLERGQLQQETSSSSSSAAAAAAAVRIGFATENVSGLSAGYPIVGEIAQIFVDIPITVELAHVNLSHAALFIAPPLARGSQETVAGNHSARMCGTPTLSMSVIASAPLSLSASTFTVMAYLYDLPPRGTLLENVGTLLTHGTYSLVLA